MDKVKIPNGVLFEEVAAVLQEGREAVILPTGKSMLPFIREGVDRVVLRKKDSFEIGDIVLAHFGGRYILHRIVALDGDAVTLMGDGNLKGQEKGRTDGIIGTVSAVIRPDGRRRVPGKGRLWRALKPVRRYLLAIYRRLI